MGLTLGDISYILIDDSILICEDFIEQIKNYIDLVKKGKIIKIFVENDISLKIKNFMDSKDYRTAYLMDGMLDLLKDNNLLFFIHTNNYLDTEEFEREIKEPLNAARYIVTQKESVYNALKDIKDKYPNIKICRYSNSSFEEWNDTRKNLNAFYLDNDDEYIYKINTNQVDYVYSNKYGYLKLDNGSQITGGEGSVYTTYNNMMAKVYKKESINYVNYKKISKMIDMNVYNQFICWPRDLLYIDGTFIGYLMDEVKNSKTLLTLRIGNFSTMNHLERFKLCLNFLKNVNYLHEKGVLIGDLKPDNILVKSPEEVYFIDCGCYQIDDYSCPVCHPEYTKREFKKGELLKQLRTEEDEYYPINKIAFEILIKKDHTYDPNNIELENQDKTKFSYPLDISNYNRTAEDAMLWKSLTPTMREYFYYYFKQGKIVHLSEWINELSLFIKKNEKEKK